MKIRLLNYRQYLIENYTLNTVRTMMNPILSIYRYHEIEILETPTINKKATKYSITNYLQRSKSLNRNKYNVCKMEEVVEMIKGVFN